MLLRLVRKLRISLRQCMSVCNTAELGGKVVPRLSESLGSYLKVILNLISVDLFGRIWKWERSGIDSFSKLPQGIQFGNFSTALGKSYFSFQDWNSFLLPGNRKGMVGDIRTSGQVQSACHNGEVNCSLSPLSQSTAPVYFVRQRPSRPNIFLRGFIEPYVIQKSDIKGREDAV